MSKMLYLIQAPHEPPAFRLASTRPPVVVCDRARVAALVAGDTGDGTTVWQYFAPDLDGSGWLLIRWRGLDIDYGYCVRSTVLPGGVPTGFYHPGQSHYADPWVLLRGAIWWSRTELPPKLAERGVLVTPESFDEPMALRRLIEEDEIAVTLDGSAWRGVGRNRFVIELSANPPQKRARPGDQWLPGLEPEKEPGAKKTPRRVSARKAAASPEA